FDLAEELKLPLAHNTNSLLYDYAPQIFARIRARGDEIVAHGRTNSENLRGLWEPDEERIIREVTEAFVRNEKKRPTGWMGAGAYETSVTPDLLKEACYTYFMDWPCDDQPIWMRTRSGQILSVPYPVEVNDSPMIVHRKRSARELRIARRTARREAPAKLSVTRRPVCSAAAARPPGAPRPACLPAAARPLATSMRACLAAAACPFGPERAPQGLRWGYGSDRLRARHLRLSSRGAPRCRRRARRLPRSRFSRIGPCPTIFPWRE